MTEIDELEGEALSEVVCKQKPMSDYDELTKLMSIDELGKSLILSVILGDMLFANACREEIKLRRPSDDVTDVLRALPRGVSDG